MCQPAALLDLLSFSVGESKQNRMRFESYVNREKQDFTLKPRTVPRENFGHLQLHTIKFLYNAQPTKSRCISLYIFGIFT